MDRAENERARAKLDQYEGMVKTLARQLGCSTQNIHQIRARLLRVLRGQRAMREIHNARRKGLHS